DFDDADTLVFPTKQRPRMPQEPDFDDTPTLRRPPRPNAPPEQGPAQGPPEGSPTIDDGPPDIDEDAPTLQRPPRPPAADPPVDSVPETSEPPNIEDDQPTIEDDGDYPTGQDAYDYPTIQEGEDAQYLNRLHSPFRVKVPPSKPPVNPNAQPEVPASEP